MSVSLISTFAIQHYNSKMAQDSIKIQFPKSYANQSMITPIGEISIDGNSICTVQSRKHADILLNTNFGITIHEIFEGKKQETIPQSPLTSVNNGLNEDDESSTLELNDDSQNTTSYDTIIELVMNANTKTDIANFAKSIEKENPHIGSEWKNLNKEPMRDWVIKQLNKLKSSQG